MVENSLHSPRAGGPHPAFLGGSAAAVVYGITAVRLEAGHVTEVMMGMVDTSLAQWELGPAPTRMVEVVDRLVEGDQVVTLFPTERGTLRVGPEVMVDVLPGGVETLVLADDRPGWHLADLPRF